MIKKTGYICLSLLILSFLVFVIIDAIPGSFYNAGILSGISKERINTIKSSENQSLELRYFNWIKSAIKGDLGTSLIYKRPVTEVLKKRFKYTFFLSLYSLIMEILLSLIISFIMVLTSKKKRIKSLNNLVIIVLLSLPVFLVGAIFKKWFALDLKLFPTSGFITEGISLTGIYKFFDIIKHLTLPALTLAVISSGSLIKFLVNAFFEELKKDYVWLVKSKGFSDFFILRNYALKNVSLPLLSYIIINIPLLFGGAILTEQIFDINGLGKLAFDAAMGRDFTLLLGYSIVFAALTFITNLLADFIYKAIDPRIKEI